MQESLEKKWDLSYLYDMSQQALEAGDIDQAIKLSKEGLEESELDANLEWKCKFEEIYQVLTQKSNKTVIENVNKENKLYENLTKIKGLGPTHEQKLWDAGYNTIKKIAQSNPNTLSRIKGIGAETARKFILSAREYLGITDVDKDLEKQQVSLDIKPKNDGINEERKPKASTSWLSSRNKPNHLTHSAPHPVKTEAVIVESVQEEEPSDDFSYQERFLKEEISQANEEDGEELEDIEDYIQEESETVYERIIKEVAFEGYYSIREQTFRENFLQEIDIILFKMYPLKLEHQILLISPIKIAQIDDTLITSEDAIEYQHKVEQNFLISAYASQLVAAQEIISEDIATKGSLFQYIQSFLMTKMDVSPNQMIKSEIALFASGDRISVYIDPILVSIADVKFLEKSIPFAWQKATNIHCIPGSQLPELLEFLERKHKFTEEYNGAEQIEDTYEHSNQDFQGKLMRYSLIPIGFGGLTIIIALAQVPTLLLPFIGLSYTMLGLYGALLGYLFYTFKIKRKNISSQFNIPSYQKSVELDDANLEIIYQELVDELMLQFGYECFGKTSQYRLLNKIEQHRTEEILTTPELSRPETSIEELFELKEDKRVYQEKLKEYFTENGGAK